MEVTSIVASFVSLILAGIAIWQAIHFYTQGKNTEARVETALAAIKAQVETLQSLNGRTLDRLTKYATTHREDGSAQVANALSVALKELPAIFLQFKVPPQDSNNPCAGPYVVPRDSRASNASNRISFLHRGSPRH